jgi:hypothetical protein
MIFQTARSGFGRSVFFELDAFQLRKALCIHSAHSLGCDALLDANRLLLRTACFQVTRLALPSRSTKAKPVNTANTNTDTSTLSIGMLLPHRFGNDERFCRPRI